MFKGNNKDTRTASWRRSGVFIVNLHHISHIFLVFLLLALNKEMPAVKALLVLNTDHVYDFANVRIKITEIALMSLKNLQCINCYLG